MKIASVKAIDSSKLAKRTLVPWCNVAISFLYGSNKIDKIKCIVSRPLRNWQRNCTNFLIEERGQLAGVLGLWVPSVIGNLIFRLPQACALCTPHVSVPRSFPRWTLFAHATVAPPYCSHRFTVNHAPWTSNIIKRKKKYSWYYCIPKHCYRFWQCAMLNCFVVYSMVLLK